MIKRLDFGGFILLRPEVLSRYGAAVVRALSRHCRTLIKSNLSPMKTICRTVFPPRV
jgi:hypothetical protein